MTRSSLVCVDALSDKTIAIGDTNQVNPRPSFEAYSFASIRTHSDKGGCFRTARTKFVCRKQS
ncbi:hypothetical protein J2R80_008377 [Bradyrhizobium sp. USDA 4541]|nr:hypothetical protein [Bradyrhizobium sp. USDA 4541]